jgi:hypothetical protein
MTTQDLMTDLRTAGITVWAEGDRVAYEPRSAMTPELTERVREQKAEILQHLEQEARIDREFSRFLSVAVETPHGLTDPARLAVVEAIAQARQPVDATVRREPDRDEHGRTAVQRAAAFRAEWEHGGYPPGVRPR